MSSNANKRSRESKKWYSTQIIANSVPTDVVLVLKEEKKARAAEEKRKRLEEAEKKRAAMQAALNKNTQQQPVERNFVIQKRTDGGPGAALGNTGFDRVTIRS